MIWAIKDRHTAIVPINCADGCCPGKLTFDVRQFGFDDMADFRATRGHEVILKTAVEQHIARLRESGKLQGQVTQKPPSPPPNTPSNKG